MQVQVLGTGCASCRILQDRTSEALRQLGVADAVEKVSDVESIAAWSNAEMPALVVDDRLVSSGALPDIPELVWMISHPTP